jgi:hypothetical protein
MQQDKIPAANGNALTEKTSGFCCNVFSPKNSWGLNPFHGIMLIEANE